MKFLFVMDAYETLNLDTETSLLIMGELINRDHEVFWVQTESLELHQAVPWGNVCQVLKVNPLQRAASKWQDLNQFQAVLLRIDPPVDIHYVQTTLILNHLNPDIAQFNSVSALRNYNEKLLPLMWPDITPPTLISRDASSIRQFIEQQETIVLKPLNDCSGRGITKLSIKDISSVDSIVASNNYWVAQKFLDAVSDGDKRVFLLEGEAIGMVNRIPGENNFLANIHQGARCESTELSVDEKSAIKRVAPFLKENGIFMAGADFIGGYLTELNITSPSAVRQINQVSGIELEKIIVDRMIQKLSG